MDLVNDVKIIPIISDEQIEQMNILAQKIWREYYVSVISESQIEYMLEKFQSFTAIKNNITNENYQCYFLNYHGINAGYFMFKIENNKMFLSKIYVDKEYRQKRIGKAGFEFMFSMCKEQDLESIWLTVNRDNIPSIRAYEKLGFVISYTQDNDIGNGFFMEDFIMEKKI